MPKPSPEPFDLSRARDHGSHPIEGLVRAISQLGSDDSLSLERRLLGAAAMLRDLSGSDQCQVWLCRADEPPQQLGEPAARHPMAGDQLRWRAALAARRVRQSGGSELEVGILGARGLLGSVRCLRKRPSRPWAPDDRRLLTTAADRFAVLLEARPRRSPELERAVRGYAHDLGNTLTAALGHVQWIAQAHPDDAQIQTSSEHALSALDFACRLSAQLRDLDAPTAHRHEALDANDVVTRVDALLRAIAGSQRELILELADRPAPIHGDAPALARVLLNLVSNARDATSRGGKITIRTGTHDDRGFIEVRDDGTGMTDEVKARIFESGFSTKPTGRGAGLGLAAVQSTATAHSADLELDSAPDSGTTIRLLFPPAE